MAAFVSGVAVRSSVSRPVLEKSGFAGARVASVRCAPAAVRMSVFTDAMDKWKTSYPAFAKRGWGVTAQAEIWNGRHAMFGMLALWITAFMKGHGLIPGGAEALDLSQWGTLADLGGNAPITKERAIVLIAHVHVLMVSVAAAIAPFSFQDRLLLEPGETDPEPAGLIPGTKLGLTEDAEVWNGRLAMLGVTSLVIAAAYTGEPILVVMNKMFGGIFF